MAKTFIALPQYGDVVAQAIPGLLTASPKGRFGTLVVGGCSLLALGFNRLWCQALNERKERGWTHFAMHHADIQAQPRWLDILHEEMERTRADVISTIIPIKDNRGLTSTGVREPQSGRIRRFTMRELQQLPQTFAAKETRFPDQWLMVNTGLWLAKLTDPWCEEVCFNILDVTFKDENGRFTAQSLPEDWNFSGWCARKGLKVCATRAVLVGHHGRACYGNDSSWGDWDIDKGDDYETDPHRQPIHAPGSSQTAPDGHRGPAEAVQRTLFPDMELVADANHRSKRRKQP